MSMKIIMVVHNQREMLQVGISALKAYGGVCDEDLIIVDNASEDGLWEWLQEQRKWNYLVCDEGLESYAVILNTAIREFGGESDYLILTPNYVVLPGALEEMQRVLYSDKNIGAVSPSVFLAKGNVQTEYQEALQFVNSEDSRKMENKEMLSLDSCCILLHHKMIEALGEADAEFFGQDVVTWDLGARAISKGFHLWSCGQAYFYVMGESVMRRAYWNDHEKDIQDRNRLKQKWKMNYFNDKPNDLLIQRIHEERENVFYVLEIGCDCGANLLEIKNLYPNARLYGVEINQWAAAIAGFFAEVQVGNIEEQSLQFNGIKFDYIILGDVLEHLRNPAATINYCKELLKKGGKIIASIPNLMHYSVFRELLNGDFTYKDMGLLDRTHIHFFTYNEIVRMFEAEGYLLEKIDYIGENDEIAREKDRKLVETLVSVSEKAQEFMFWAYQYLVIARYS